MKKKTLAIINTILVILIIIGINTIFSPCKSKNGMNCTISTNYVILLMLLELMASIVNITFKKCNIIFNIFSIICSLFSILIPAVIIGGCKMSTMACQSKTFPFIYLMVTITIIINIIDFISNIKHINK